MSERRSSAPGEERSIALALVNSRQRRGRELVDQIETADMLGAWLASRSLAAPDQPITSSQLDRVRALRDAIRTLMHAEVSGTQAPAGALQLVNEAAAVSPRTPALEWSAEHGPTRRYRVVDAEAFQSAVGTLAIDAIELLTDERQAQIVECSGPGCVRFLLKDHPRRQWCSPGCSERARSARYYRRHRAEPND